MEIALWVGVLVVCLIVLVKAADYFTTYSEKLGLALGLSSFIIGATIVAVGTSLPELVSSIFAVVDGDTTFPIDNIVGSNVANALLILGIGALYAKTLKVETSLVDVDLPFFFSSMGLFVFFALDARISVGEAILLLMFFVIFVIYSTKDETTDAEDEAEDREEMKDLSEQFELDKPKKAKKAKKGKRAASKKKKKSKTKVKQPIGKYILLILVSGVAVTISARFLITSITTLSELLGVSSSLLTITIVALGTSLPEVMTSIAAIKMGNHGIAIGNVFGSNTFNLLLVGGLPALVSELTLSPMIQSGGLAFLGLATLVAIFVTLDDKIRLWEGASMLFLYGVFILRIIEVI